MPFSYRCTPRTAGSGGVTHKVAVTSLKEVDEHLVAWLKKAYEARGAC